MGKKGLFCGLKRLYFLRFLRSSKRTSRRFENRLWHVLPFVKRGASCRWFDHLRSFPADPVFGNLAEKCHVLPGQLVELSDIAKEIRRQAPSAEKEHVPIPFAKSKLRRKSYMEETKLKMMLYNSYWQ